MRRPVFLADRILGTIVCQLAAEGCTTPVLPHDGVVDRPASLPIPHDGCFALIGDAQSHHVAGAHTSLAQDFHRRAELRRKNRVGIMLDPTGLRVDLLELMLSRPSDFARLIEEDRARTGSALIE